MIDTKSPIIYILQSQRPDYEAAIDASQRRVFRKGDLSELLKPFRFVQKPESSVAEATLLISQDDIIRYLLAESYLKSVSFNLYRKEHVFIWREVSSYLLLPVLRPKGYYSHASALYFNGLIEKEPEDVFFNFEQVSHGRQGELEQARIDNAFRNRQRQTTAKTLWSNKVFWYLNGKQTGNYGVKSLEINAESSIQVTNLERTLIDVVVRPSYAGGVENVLSAFRTAKPRLSKKRLVQTLRALDYTYPYHQSVGFYLEHSGYDQGMITAMREFDEMEFDFYLDYRMNDPQYNKSWRIFYPPALISHRNSE